MALTDNDNGTSSGAVAAVRGAVVDIRFAGGGGLPGIDEAVVIVRPDGAEILAEVQAHLDRNTVRCIALQPTAGLRRGDGARPAGGAITTPVGDNALGRLLTVSGAVGDKGAPLAADTPRWPIHRAPPPLSAQSGATDLFMTGIKVIDLLTPLAQGGKAAMFGGA
ncbi:MAG: F0F1 ATP synthase subunit beta, partial [Rhodobiaceae bacterium]|nr:F0F1 ATP synthase subunit beta [Rhodobiaceae bacterium]